VGFSWRSVGIATAAAVVAGCATILGIDDGIPRDAATDAAIVTNDASDTDAPDASADAPTEAAPTTCDVDASFDPPIAFSTLDSTANDAHLRLSSNELVGFFESSRDGGTGGYDVYSATRATIGDTWTGVTLVSAVDSTGNDEDPSLSGDSLALYMQRGAELYRATRGTPTATFAAPVALAATHGAGTDFAPYVIESGNDLYFASTRNDVDAGVASLFVTQPLGDGGFTPVAAVSGTALTTGDNRYAAVTPDDLVLYFASSRAGGQGGFDIWVSTRASTSAAFGAPRVVAEVSSTKDEFPDWISSDRCRLYFTSDRGTGDDNVFVASKTP